MAAQAQTYTLNTIVNFTGANGSYPTSGVIADSSGNLYGTTNSGGNLSLNNGNA